MDIMAMLDICDACPHFVPVDKILGRKGVCKNFAKRIPGSESWGIDPPANWDRQYDESQDWCCNMTPD